MVTGNSLHHNVAGDDSVPFHGGLIVAAWSARKLSDDNTVTGNDLWGNHPNFVWDGLGAGNVFDDNACHVA